MNVITNQTYKPEAIRALREFKALKTFKPEVTLEQRLAAMQTLINALASVYAVPVPIIVEAQDIDGSDSGLSSVRLIDGPEAYFLITMRGKLSIITLLHEFAHVRFNSGNELKVQKWAVNLFRKVYPKQFERLHQVDGTYMLVA